MLLWSKSKTFNRHWPHYREVGVLQNILRERRLQMQHLQQLQEKQDEQEPRASSKATAQRKYKCQGAVQLLKTLHQQDRQAGDAKPSSAAMLW